MNLYQVNQFLSETKRSLMEFSVGQTFEGKNIRVTRRANSLKVTDLTNAGRRGKKVDIFSIYDIDRMRTSQIRNVLDKYEKTLAHDPSYDVALKYAKRVIDVSEKAGDVIDIELLQRKGIEVDPPGFKPVDFTTKKISLRANGSGFSVRDLTDPNEQTMMTPRTAKKTAIKKFLAWVSRNESRARGMSFKDFRDVMKKEGIKFHYYLGMD